ncbi:DUF1643 domain-containing protein [Miniphocaeibacter halophilus]|uniref:DUF1643 domain-containing protein n=1 Tax=Miniphocaeibacter halophilus TaxID=2931922 RepID=A0AC61MS02_9FIRM|nr:DUF1643 domain-containing protein [Miniphocaeibacter halophilus]QQK06971.1 DUF1643 domain-containing protein [Miniphocaeibacter halophilus]
MIKYKDYVDKDNIEIENGEISGYNYRYSIEIPILNSNYRKDNRLLICSMNPSKATKIQSDNTLNKLCKYAYENNYKTLTVVGILPFYETNSKDLNKFNSNEFENIIDENFNRINEKMNYVDNIIIATGNPTNKGMEKLIFRLKKLLESKNNLFCFKTNTGELLTKRGFTVHPLYLKELVACNLPEEYFYK